MEVGRIFKNKKLGEKDLWNKLTLPNPWRGGAGGCPCEDEVKSEIPASKKMAGMCMILDFLEPS